MHKVLAVDFTFTLLVLEPTGLSQGPWHLIPLHFQPQMRLLLQLPQPGEAHLRSPGLPKDQSLVGSSPAFPPLLGSLLVSETKGRVTSISQIFSPITYAFLTFSILLWRLNPYLLQATKKGSSITIQKSHKVSKMHFSCIFIWKANLGYSVTGENSLNIYTTNIFYCFWIKGQPPYLPYECLRRNSQTM